MATDLVVLLDPMLNQPGKTTINEQHLSHKVSLISMQLWYDAQHQVFTPMLHGAFNQLLGSLTVFLGRVFFVNCLEHRISEAKRISDNLADFFHLVLLFFTVCNCLQFELVDCDMPCYLPQYSFQVPNTNSFQRRRHLTPYLHCVLRKQSSSYVQLLCLSNQGLEAHSYSNCKEE